MDLKVSVVVVTTVVGAKDKEVAVMTKDNAVVETIREKEEVEEEGETNQ